MLSFPELYEAYPELQDVTMKYIVSDDRFLGRISFRGDAAIIFLNTPKIHLWKRVLLHEIQHWIQDNEGSMEQ